MLVCIVSIFCVAVAGATEMASLASSTDYAININNIENNGDSNSSKTFKREEPESISFLKDCNCLKGKTVIPVVEACRSGVGTLGR